MAVVPPRLHHDYNHQHLLREQRNEGVEPQGLRADGLPVLNLYIRAHSRHVSACVCVSDVYLLRYYLTVSTLLL